MANDRHLTAKNMGWSIRVSLVLLGVMVSAPFLEPRHFQLFRHFYSEWLAAALGLAACIALVVGETARGLAVPRIIVVPIGLIAIALLQLAVQQPVYPSQAFVFMLYLVWAGALAVLGHELAGSVGLPRLATVLAWGLVAGGLVNALIGLLQFAGAGSFYGLAILPSEVVVGNLGQQNHFADQLWLACAAALYLFVEKRLSWAIFLPVTAMLLCASILSGSRTVFFYLIAIVALAFFWYRRLPEAEGSKRLFHGALVVLGLFAALQIALPNLHRLFPGVNVVTSLGRMLEQASDPVRLMQWKAALNIFQSFPLLGAGVGQFSWQMFLVTGPPWFGSQESEHAHNVVMQLLAEFGLFAALLVMGGLLAWLVRVLKQKPTAELWLALALIAVTGIHSQLEYPLWYTFFLGPFALILGAADPGAYALQAARAVRIGLVGVMLGGAVFLVNALVDYAPLRYGFLPSVHSELQDAPPAPPEVLGQLRRNVLYTANIDLRLAAAMPLEGEPRADKLALCKDALRHYPVWQVAYKCALLHALEGQPEQAAFLWRRAMTVFPAQLPGIVDDLHRRPEARDGVLVPLRLEAEKELAELRGKGLLPDDRVEAPAACCVS